MARIGILNSGLHGHLRPASRLGRALAARGHAVVAWGPEEVRDVIEQGGVELRAEGAILDGEPIRDFMLGAALAAVRAAEEVEPVIERLHRERIDLVVYDCMFPAGRLAAEWLGLPRVCSVPLFPPGAGRVADPEVVRRASAAGPPSEQLVQALHDSREELGLRWGLELGGLREVAENPGDLNLVYTTPEIAGAAPPDDSWRFVGPLLDPVEAAPARERDAPPLVYMALGTLFSNQPTVFRAAHRRARRRGRTPARRDGRPARAPRISSRCRRTPRSSSTSRPRAVLSDAAVHITHGGANSVHESLAAGVPMVCLPQGADKWSWAQRIAELGVGQVLTDPTSESVRDAVTGLLRDEGARRRAAELGAHLADVSRCCDRRRRGGVAARRELTPAALAPALAEALEELAAASSGP